MQLILGQRTYMCEITFFSSVILKLPYVYVFDSLNISVYTSRFGSYKYYDSVIIIE